MEYVSWPHVISTDQRVLYTLLHGHLYKLAPHDDIDAQLRANPLTLYKDDQPIADISVEGKIVDFTVNHELVALATIQPAGLHLCRPFKNTAVLYMKIPLDAHKKEDQVISNITLGNYGSNIIVVWHGPGVSPVYIGMVSGRDAFRFDPMPLVFYDQTGRQRMYYRQANEKVLAVPHMPSQYGAIATISPMGMMFYKLQPFYTLNKLHNEHKVHMPFSLEPAWTEPDSANLPDRLQFSSYDLLVNITGNHMTMKYDPLQSARNTTRDWVKVIVDGNEITQSQYVYMSPIDTDRTFALEPRVTATDITIHADLPVTFKLDDQVMAEEVSQTGIRFLPKNTQKMFTMRTYPCLSRWQLARFAEKFNLKIRAEVWG